MSNIYQKSKYYQPIDMHGGTEIRYVYGHYNSVFDVWGFKDYDGKTLINLCFENVLPNKLTAIWDIYNNHGENITEEEYNNIWNEMN